MEGAPRRSQRVGKHFPVSLFRWQESHKYVGEEVGHLWFTKILGPDGYGNIVVTWRGPMDVKLENVKDQTERLQWGAGTRIRGPDLYHIIAEFPQIGNDLPLMYSFQAMLAQEVALAVWALGRQPEVRGSDVYIDGGKLNVGVCAAWGVSCTMHFAVNISTEGTPSIPKDVNALGLGELVGSNDAVEIMRGVVTAWLARIDALYLKAYKTA